MGYCCFVGWEISSQTPHEFFSQMTAINFFHLAPAIEVLETVTIWGTRVYAIGSEIFTVTAILWCLNFLGNMTQKTFQFGYAFGKFYRRYLHSHLKSTAIRVIALLILLGQLTFEGAQVVYNNRREILENVNIFRTTVGSYFVYASWEGGTGVVDLPLFSCIVVSVEKFIHVWWTLVRNQWLSGWDLRRDRFQGRVGERREIWCRKAHQR